MNGPTMSLPEAVIFCLAVIVVAILVALACGKPVIQVDRLSRREARQVRTEKVNRLKAPRVDRRDIPTTYVCPRPECQRTSKTRVYCRHGQPADIAVGNWMLDENDPLLCSLPPAVIAESEAAEARVALLEYAASDTREWIRAFELRTCGGQGKSMRSIDRAYKQLVDSGELEEGESDLVRLRPAGDHQ